MINVHPLNDLHAHTEGSTCNCSPEVKEIEGTLMLIHNAYDHREQLEEIKIEDFESEAAVDKYNTYIKTLLDDLMLGNIEAEDFANLTKKAFEHCIETIVISYEDNENEQTNNSKCFS